MAKLMTYAEAISRFANLATTGIGIEEAIQEAVDRIYEMGRWPGTTVEVELAEADFIEGDNDNEWFVYFPEETYDGAVGFRSNHRGWSIVDHSSLYRDGVNAGDREFLDMGTVTIDSTTTLAVTGTLTLDGSTSVTFPSLIDAGVLSVGNTWTDTGDGVGTSYFVQWSNGLSKWELVGLVSPGDTEVGWRSAETTLLLTPSPDLATGWAPVSPATGTPSVDWLQSSTRKYRAPLGFVPSAGPYFALMKLEAPALVNATVIPIHSAGALKCAILAVCQEYVNDDDRAMLNWQKFETFITKAARQVDGPKRWSIGMDSSLRRKPTQFL